MMRVKWQVAEWWLVERGADRGRGAVQVTRCCGLGQWLQGRAVMGRMCRDNQGILDHFYRVGGGGDEGERRCR